jgi:HEAT repeat protein
MLGRRIFLAFVLVLVGVVVGVAIGIANVPRGAPPASVTDANPAVRAEAIRAMGWHGDANVFIEALRDKNADVRLLAAEHLGGGDFTDGRQTAALIAALRDPHAGVRRAAAESLCSIGPASGPALIKALTDPDPQVRAAAALALGDFGLDRGWRRRASNEVQTITPLLKKLLDDEEPEVRRNAAHTLEVLSEERR